MVSTLREWRSALRVSRFQTLADGAKNVNELERVLSRCSLQKGKASFALGDVFCDVHGDFLCMQENILGCISFIHPPGRALGAVEAG